MIDLFHARRVVFEEIRSKACQKAGRSGDDIGSAGSQIIMMDPSWSKPEVSGAERDEYYALFRLIDAKGVQAVISKGKCEVWIEYWGVGWAGDADYKKFVFGKPDPDDRIVQSLDNLPLGMEIVFYRRELVDGWWLAYDHRP